MKKSLLFLTFLLVMLGTFTGLNAVTTWTVPGTYPTLGGVGGAIAALNALTLPLTDSYVIDVAPGYTETLTGRLTLTATGTTSYSITIKKASAGTNPLLTAYLGTGVGATADGMFALSGSDYVTIDGIDLYDPNTASNTTMMEYGYGLFKAGVADGAQYNTIQNCTVTLNRNNLATQSLPLTEGAACITMPNSTLAAPTTALTPTVAAGTNSYNKFYANYLTNANYGIVMIGYAAVSPFTLGDTANDIGGVSAGTGNQIINFGGGVGATVPSAAVRSNNQWGWNVSYNVINNNNGSGVNHPNTFRGIYGQAGTSANCTLNYNDISLKSAATTSAVRGIECAIGSTPVTSNTVSISYNNVHDCTYTTATTGTFDALYCTSNPVTLNFNNNVIVNNSLAGTGQWAGLYPNSVATTLNMNYNQVYNNTKTGASGALYLSRANTSLITFTYNELHDCSIPSTTGTSAATIYGYYNLASATVENYSNNQIYNLSIGGAGTSTASILQGIYTYTTTSVKTINNNLIYGLQYTAAGAASVIGIRNNTGTVEIGRNKVYNLATAGSAGVVTGIGIEGSTLATVHNNMIYGLQAPGSTTAAAPPAIRGISSTVGANNVYYNSVLLNYAGANAYFSSACLYLSISTDVRNNIFVNKCTPGATGLATAIWSTGTTTPFYVGASSNKNIYYTIATPDATHPIGYMNSTAYASLAQYKTAVATTDQGSYAEDVPFQGPTRTVNLHIDPSVATRVEGNAVSFYPNYDSDFDGDNRNNSTPDIGADEGDFTAIVAAPGIPVYSSPGNGTNGIAINAPLNWSADSGGGTPTSYEVYFGEAATPPYLATVTSPTYSPVMQYSKTYYWQIKAINAQGSALGAIWSFSTMADPNNYTYPYNMDFEEITVAGNLPQYWSKIGTRWTSMTTVPGDYNRGPRGGTDYLTCQYSSGATDWMFSRGMYLDSSKLYDLGMWYKTDGIAGWTSCKMFIGTAASSGAMVTELASVLGPTNLTYTQLSKTAWQPPVSGVYFVGFNVIATSGPWYMSFDDFSIAETPLNPLFAINPTSMDFGTKGVFTQTDQLFTLSNAGQGTLTISEILLEGDAPFSFVTPPSTPILLNNTNPTATFTIRYRPTTAGTWVGNVKITDDLSGRSVHNVALNGVSTDPIQPIPYTQNFSAGTTLPTNWTQSTSTWTIGSTHGRTNNGIYKNIWSSAPSAWFQTQPIGPITGTTKLTFYYRLINYTGYPTGSAFAPGAGDVIKIWVSTDEGTNFTQYGEINSSNHTTSLDWAAKPIWLSGFKANANDRIVLKFEATWATGDWFIDIDDITVDHVNAAPVFTINPTSNDYGSLQIGTTASQVFTISNSGINPLVIAAGGISLTGAGISAYTLTDTNAYPISLTGTNTATVTVTFAPTVASASPYVASLQVVDNTSKATQNVPLTGLGVDMTIYDLPHYVTLSETPQAQYWMQENIGTGITNRWSISTTGNAGGLTPEFHCYYQTITGTTRLISPPVSVTGLSELVVKYKQQIDDFGAGCTYKFRYGYAPDSFFDIWTFASAANTTYPAEEKTFSLTTELTGHSNVYFCWEIEGNLNQFDNWYIDNIKFLTTNTEVNQATAAVGAVDISIPPILNLTTNTPLSTSVQLSGMLAQTPLIDVDVAYTSPGVNLQNDGLYMHLTGTLLDGVRVQGAHNLGFNPPQVAYRFNSGPWTFVDPTPPTVLAPDSFFDIFLETFGKAGDDVEIVFPLNDDDPLPVELSSFTAVMSAENYVNLTWVTQSETGVQGYYVYRSTTAELDEALIVSPMIDATNSSEQHAYQYTDSELTADGTYYYWLQNIDFGGNMAYHGPVSVYYNSTGNDPTPEIPLFTELKAVYPNPFNPTAFIPYSIANAADVSFKIYNSRGQLLRNFDLGTKAPGNYRISWNGTDSNGSTCGNGIYYFVMKAGKDSFQRKAVLLK